MPGVWNVFTIGRDRRNEDQLTEMLAWLVDAVPDVGSAIAGFAFDEPQIDGNIQITTQHGVAKGRLDALVVESKIDSGFGDDQITRYLAWLDKAHGHRARRGLMTLTVHPAPWSPADVELAHRLEIKRCEHLWEELHAVFEPLVGGRDSGELSARLVGEFLEMLGEERLIPMKPLEPTEYTLWRDAWMTVRRFQDFFLACRDAIGDALGATAATKSVKEGYVWQDYVYRDGSKIAVGLACTDEERVRRSAVRRKPFLWMAVEATQWADWEVAKATANAPRIERADRGVRGDVLNDAYCRCSHTAEQKAWPLSEEADRKAQHELAHDRAEAAAARRSKSQRALPSMRSGPKSGGERFDEYAYALTSAGSGLTLPPMHHARDVQDQRKLEAAEYAELVESYYEVDATEGTEGFRRGVARTRPLTVRAPLPRDPCHVASRDRR